MRRIATLSFVCSTVALLGGCASARGSGAGGSAVITAAGPAVEYVPGQAGAIERARADSLRYPYTQADIDFMSGMIHHHAQAIVMSNLAPTREASPELLRLTARIINAQTDEINLMQTWLRDREQPVPEPNAAGMPMSHGDGTHSMLMPGMLTAEQMAQLEAARGVEFDRLFLALMIQHHRGAVSMVQTLLASHGAAQNEVIYKFAADVQVDQTTEIRRMMQMLLERGGIPPA